MSAILQTYNRKKISFKRGKGSYLYSNNGKIYFEKNKYFKIVNNNKKIYFSNKRIDRIIVNYERHFLNLLDQYSINKLKINCEISLSKFPVGSSAKRSLGSFAIALQIAIRCFSPPDN